MGVKPNIELHIEELVLHGIAAGDRDLIRITVEAELARLFADEGAPAAVSRDREVRRIDGGSFRVAPDSPIEAIGYQVASAAYRSLRK